MPWKNLLIRIDKRWFIKSVALFIPTIWFSAIAFWEDKEIMHILNLMNDKGPTTTCTILSIVICSMGFLFLLASNYYSQSESRALTNRNWIFQHIAIAQDESNQEEYSNLLGYIDKCKGADKFEHPFKNTTHPKSNVKQISDALADCIYAITGIVNTDIDISLAYRTDIDNQWSWFDSSAIRSEISVKDLLDQPNSTLSKMIANKKNYLFWNSKIKAAALNEYYLIPEDIEDGSLIGRRLTINTAKKNSIEAILFISTFGANFTDKKNQVPITKRIFDKHILPSFECSIKVELLKCYIKHSYENQRMEVNSASTNQLALNQSEEIVQ